MAEPAEETPRETHTLQLMRGATAQVEPLFQFSSEDEQLDESAKSKYTQSEVRCSQKRRRETHCQDLEASERSRRPPPESMQLPSRPNEKIRCTGLPLELQRKDEEITSETLSAAFELTGEVRDLFYTRPAETAEELRRYFHQYSSGRGEIDALLIAAMGAVPTSPTDAFTHRHGEVRATDTGWLARQLSQSRAKPVRDPQADSETIGEHNPSHHAQHINQAASLQSQMTHQQRHLYGWVANNLDDCLLTLADGQNHVMKAMFWELREIVDNGYAQTFPHILASGKLSIQARSFIKKALRSRCARKSFNPVTFIRQGNDP